MTVKGPKTLPGILQSIHYEAIVRSPDGLGVESAVRGLASLLVEPARTDFLVNVAREYRQAYAGEAASRLLVEMPVEESSHRGVDRFGDVIARAGDTGVPVAAVRSACLKSAAAAWARHVPYQARSLEKDPCGPELLSRCGERLAGEGRWDDRGMRYGGWRMRCRCVHRRRVRAWCGRCCFGRGWSGGTCGAVWRR